MFKEVFKFFYSSKKADSIMTEKTPSESISIRPNEIPKGQEDILQGMEFVANMSLKTPLHLLKMDGQISETLKVVPLQYGIWVPKVKPEFTINIVDATRSSDIGPIPSDGGDFLVFLKKARHIIETTKNSKGDIQLGIDVLEGLKALSKNSNEDYMVKLFRKDEDALKFILTQISEFSFKGLTISNIKTMYKKGYMSIKDILNADEIVLLELKGVGPTKLKTIKQNQKEIR